MISYIYMLLITVICYLWQGIAKEQVDFFKMASTNTSINMKYDYLYTALVNAKSLCSVEQNCISGMTIILKNYKFSHPAKICKNGIDYYVFYTDAILTQKPTVSLTAYPDLSLIHVKDVPPICVSTTIHNEDNYALKMKIK